jgi:hypothetical protein
MRQQKNSNKIGDIKWYVDIDARKKNKPGIYHSYMFSFAQSIRNAKAAEEEGINSIKEYLSQSCDASIV